MRSTRFWHRVRVGKNAWNTDGVTVNVTHLRAVKILHAYIWTRELHDLERDEINGTGLTSSRFFMVEEKKSIQVLCEQKFYLLSVTYGLFRSAQCSKWREHIQSVQGHERVNTAQQGLSTAGAPTNGNPPRQGLFRGTLNALPSAPPNRH